MEWCLTGEGVTAAEDDCRHYAVVPFLECRSRRYWLAVSIAFDHLHGHHYLVADAAAVVFEGRATDERKMPLLRAEWVCEAPGTNSPHAQPHWHVYSSQAEATMAPPVDSEVTAQPRVFDPEAVLQDTAASRAPTPSPRPHFHYAMASRWHSDGPACHTSLLQRDDALADWLEGCLRYTQEQLRRLVARSDRSAQQ